MSQANTPVRWRMIILVPIWSVQLFFLAPYVVVLGLLIGITEKPEDDGNNSKPGLQSWNIVDLVIASVGLILTCLEIVMQTQRSLHPSFYLGSSIVKIIMWTISLVLSIVAVWSEWAKSDGFNKWYLYVTIAATGLVYIPTIVSLVYGIIVFRRYRERVQELVNRYV